MDALTGQLPPLTAAQVSWTPERVEQLKSLWDQGLSCSLISVEMGITRNAVIGKASRLKLVKRLTIMRKPSVSRAGSDPVAVRRPLFRKKTQRQNSNSGGIWNRIDSMLRDAKKACADLPIDSSPLACTIEGLISNRSQCRYPVTTPEGQSQLFCAADVVEGMPYCARHCDVCYTRNARQYGESSIGFFQSIGSVAVRVVENLEQQRRIDDPKAA